jgi:hypothetical protein
MSSMSRPFPLFSLVLYYHLIWYSFISFLSLYVFSVYRYIIIERNVLVSINLNFRAEIFQTFFEWRKGI